MTTLMEVNPMTAVPVPDDGLYSSTEVCHAANVTYRQIDYWCRTGLLQEALPANGSGTARRFDADDLRVACALGYLSRNGSAVNGLGRKLVDHVRAHGLHGQVTSDDGVITIDLLAIEDPT